ncbi:MAG: NrsF family protein [Gemmobacter sp.]
MKTDDLIRALAADTVREPALRTTLLLGLAPSLVIGVLAVWFGLGFRADLSTALVSPVSAARILLTGVLGLAATRLALLLARPDGGQTARLWPLTAVAVAALGLLLWAYVTTPEDARQMAMFGKTMTNCLVAIPLLSILPVTTLHYVLRQGATTAPARAGFVAGLAGSGLAAATYALYCTEDSPLFYVTWYGLAIMGVTLVSTVVGARSLRW